MWPRFDLKKYGHHLVYLVFLLVTTKPKILRAALWLCQIAYFQWPSRQLACFPMKNAWWICPYFVLRLCLPEAKHHPNTAMDNYIQVPSLIGRSPVNRSISVASCKRLRKPRLFSPLSIDQRLQRPIHPSTRSVGLKWWGSWHSSMNRGSKNRTYEALWTKIWDTTQMLHGAGRFTYTFIPNMAQFCRSIYHTWSIWVMSIEIEWNRSDLG